jgi:L,D-transpeptidase YbiS
MRAKAPAVLIIVFSVLALAMAELLYPMRESLKVDVTAGVMALLTGQTRLDSLQARIDTARVEIKGLEDSLGRAARKMTPAEEDSLYLVVDTHTNQLFVRRGNSLLRSCPAATGSNRQLQHWFFATPRGIMYVRDKRVDPVWIKPDWAFVEEGEEVPPLNSPERLVHGHLGEYALILGGGIMIHGTSDLESLGRNASHGCIRLGREDLRYVYQATDIGAKVYIF